MHRTNRDAAGANITYHCKLSTALQLNTHITLAPPHATVAPFSAGLQPRSRLRIRHLFSRQNTRQERDQV